MRLNSHDGARAPLAAIKRNSRVHGILASAGVCALALVLAGCSGGSSLGGGSQSSEKPTGPLKVGFLATLSGTEAPSGEDMVNGFKLYLAQHDNKLGDRTVDLTVANSGGAPASGLAAAQKLISQDHVDVIAGVTISPVALAITDLVTSSKVPLVISNAGANAVTGAKKSQYVWRVSFANCQPDYAMGSYVKSIVGDGSVYVIARDDAAGHEHTDGFVNSFKAAGGKIAGSAFPPFGTTQNYQPYLSQIQQSGAKAVFSFFAGGEAVTFVNQYNQFGLKGEIPLFGSGYLTADGHVITSEGDSAVGIRTSLNYSPTLDNPENKKFVKEYKAQYKVVPDLYAAQSWDAAAFIDQGLKKTNGNSKADKLTAAWGNLGTLKSPRGDVTIDKNHNAVQDWYVLEGTKSTTGYENVVKKDLDKVTNTCE